MSGPDRTESASFPVLQVRCESWREFAEAFADDIVSGGLYVAHATPLPALQAVIVQLLLPEATEIVLHARVVQVMGAPQAETLGKAPGLALELLDLDGERKRQVVQLIEFARWQGANGDPTSSFARMMLELSPSLPPRELALRLSQLPAAARPESRPALPAVQTRSDSQTNLPAQRAPSRSALPAAQTRRDSQPSLPAQRVPSAPAQPAASPAPQRAFPSSTSLRTPSQPPAASSASSPSPRHHTQSLTAPSPRSGTQSLPAAPRQSGQSVRSMPAVQARPRVDSGTLQPATREAHVRRESGQTLAPGANAHVRRDSGQTLSPPRDASAVSRESQTLPATISQVAPSKPTDQLKLRLVLSNVAHKHYDAALIVTREMLVENPGDPQALRWQLVCEARLALQRGEPALARAQYEELLRLDPAHREAREFIRVHERDRKLSSLPFGRYFTKKK